jgi:hypothetical protein
MLPLHHIRKVRLAGLEPAAMCLRGTCSFLLSYKRRKISIIKVRRLRATWTRSPFSRLGD